MTRLYAIHEGSYSDQSWGPVFSTVERALAYKQAHPKEEIEIEVHVLDNEGDTGPVYPSWWVVFDRDGNPLGAEVESTPAPYESAIHKPEASFIPQKDCLWYMLNRITDRNKAHILVRLMAADRDHAVKIAADARAQHIALG